MPVKLGFIILSLIGVLRIPEEFYLYKDKDKRHVIIYIIMLSVKRYFDIYHKELYKVHYAKKVHLLCQFHAGKVGVSAVCQAIYS